MSAFAAWLMGFAKSFLMWLYNNTIDLLQGAIDGFVTFALSIVALFPAGPSLPSFSEALPSGSVGSAFLNGLNWFFPIQFFLLCVGFVVAAMVAYFVIAPLARWVKLLT